jgi:hypothetical protein
VQSPGVEILEPPARRRNVRSRATFWFETLSLAAAVVRIASSSLALVGCHVYDDAFLHTTGAPDAAATDDVSADKTAADAKSDAKDATVMDNAGGASMADRGATGGGGAGAGGSAGRAGAAGSGGSAGSDGSAESGGQGGAAGASGLADASRDSGDGDGDGKAGCNAGAEDAACFDVGRDSGVVDQCPSDPLKTEPGICGCGTPDTDSDLDGAADCVDACPTDPNKTEPRFCGCNVDDSSDPDAGLAFCIKAVLIHRYSFNGTGTTATDSIGTAHGAIVGGTNATMSGGSVSLSGDLGARYTSEGYVSLPSDLLNALTSVTFEAWITWRGAGSSGSRVWQRIFDFGSQVTSGSELVGGTYLFLTPYATSSGLLRAAFSANGSANETLINGASAFPLNVQAHVAVVADDAGDTLTLYLNGAPEGSVAWAGTLAAIDDVHGWLGRSNYGFDPELNGIVHEFRIFRAALTAAQIRASYLAGPDPPFF